MPTSGTKSYTTQDLLNAVGGEHGATADANGILLVGGGVHAGVPTAVTGTAYVRTWLNKFGYTVPERQNILIGSLTTASATTTAVVGTATGLGAFRDLDILVDVTGTSGTASTLTVYVDSRLDGTTYTNIGAGTLMTTISSQVIHLTKRQISGVAMVTALAGAGTVRAIGWADDVQVRYTMAGTTSAMTFRVWFNGIG